MAESPKPILEILDDLPGWDEIRKRIAENLQERQTLRQLLKLAERRERSPVSREAPE
jgi:hypothetical protein